MWSDTLQRIVIRKTTKGHLSRAAAPLATVSPIPDVSIITVAAFKSMNVSYLQEDRGVALEMILDSGSFVSLVTQ